MLGFNGSLVGFDERVGQCVGFFTIRVDLVSFDGLLGQNFVGIVDGIRNAVAWFVIDEATGLFDRGAGNVG